MFYLSKLGYAAALWAGVASLASAAPAIHCTGVVAPGSVLRSEGVAELVGPITIGGDCAITNPGDPGSQASYTIQMFTSGGVSIVSSDPPPIVIQQPAGLTVQFPGDVSGNSVTFNNVMLPTAGADFTMMVPGIRVNASQIPNETLMTVTVLAASTTPGLVNSDIFMNNSLPSAYEEISSVAVALKSLSTSKDLLSPYVASSGGFISLHSCDRDAHAFDTSKSEASGENSPNKFVSIKFASVMGSAFAPSLTDGADKPTRLAFRITNVPRGVTLYAPTVGSTVVGTGSATLVVGYDENLANGHLFNTSGSTAMYLALTPDSNGTVTAVYELGGFAADYSNKVGVNVYAAIRSPLASSSPSILSAGYAPLSAAEDVPRFIAGDVLSSDMIHVADCVMPPPPPPVLTPTCSLSVSPANLAIPVSGGTSSVRISASDNSCSWFVAGLPVWVNASATSGFGSATVSLTAPPNAGIARSATANISGSMVQISQPGTSAACAYALGGRGQSLPAPGGSGSISITATDGCAWTASPAPTWVTYTGPASGTGSGSIAYSVAANAGTRRSGEITVSGLPYTISQLGAVSSRVGSLAHFASGGGWRTTFTLVNTDFGPAQAQLGFFDIDGHTISQASASQNSAHSAKALADSSTENVAGTLNPGAALQIDAPATLISAGDGGQGSLAGSAQLSTNGKVGGFGVVRLITANDVQEAAVPLETRDATSYFLPFDNTGGYFYAVALSSSAGMEAGIGITVRDSQTGAVVFSDSILLPAFGHESFLLAERYPALAGTTGTVQLSGQFRGQLSVLGLRFNANHAFTSVPALINAPSSGSTLANAGALPHLVAGGGWKTIYTLANTGSTPAEAKLSFFGDDGKPLALALRASQAGSSTTQAAPSFDQILKPGTLLSLETTATADQSTQAGWAQLATTGSISGFAFFQATSAVAAQEAAVPLDAANASDLLLAFDNTHGYSNGIALSNTSAQAISVAVSIRDATTGDTVATDTLHLAASGHLSFMLADKYGETANLTGTLELNASAGATISAIGLRVNANRAFTSVPVLAKQ